MCSIPGHQFNKGSRMVGGLPPNANLKYVKCCSGQCEEDIRRAIVTGMVQEPLSYLFLIPFFKCMFENMVEWVHRGEELYMMPGILEIKTDFGVVWGTTNPFKPYAEQRMGEFFVSVCYLWEGCMVETEVKLLHLLKMNQDKISLPDCVTDGDRDGRELIRRLSSFNG